jgi:TonB family protein
MFEGIFRSIHGRWGVAGLISGTIHIIFLVLASAYVIRNPEIIKQVYVEIISNDVKAPEPKPKVKFRPTKIATDLSPTAPSYSEFLPKLESVPKSNPSPIGGTNLAGIKSDVILPYGEGLLRNADSIPKVNSLSSAVYEMRKTTRFEPKVSEMAKAPVLAVVPPKVNHIPSQLSIEFKDLTATGLEIPKPSEVERIEPPKWTNKVKPEYPEAARRAGIEGVVVLEVEVRADGSLGEIKVVESLGYGCDEAAEAALKASKIAPAKRNGVPITMKTQAHYKFQLEK